MSDPSKQSSTESLEILDQEVCRGQCEAAVCIECGGGHFEHMLKKAQKDAAEE